jgi:PAS domain S-box-containing protein
MASPKSLRSRLMLLILVVALPLAGLAVFSAVRESREDLQRATQELEVAAALVAANQERAVLTARQLLYAAAHSPGLLTLTDAQCQRYFITLNEQLSSFANVGLATPEGLVRCHGLDGPQGVFINDREFFRNAVSTMNFSVGALMISRLSNQPTVPVALPLRGADKSLQGVVFGGLDLTGVAKDLAHVPLPDGGQLAITDRQGLVVAAHPADAAIVGQALVDDAMRRALPVGGSTAVSHAPSTGDRIVAFRSSGLKQTPDFYVVVSADRQRVLAPSQQLLAQQLIAISLVTALSALLGWLIGGRGIVQPAQRIVEIARQMQQGRTGARVLALGQGATAELVAIAEGMNEMAQGLQAREHALQTELVRTQRMQRKLIDAQRLGHIGNWELDLSGQYLWWSDEVSTMFGLAPGEFDGRPETLMSMIHPDDRERFREQREIAISRNIELDIEYAIVTPAGDMRWVHQIGRLQHDENGRPVCRAGVVQDITARKISELALANSNDLLRRTGEMARIGGWTLELASRELVCSEQLLQIHEVDTGGPLSFAESLAVYPLPGRERLENAIDDACKNGIPWDFELPMTTRLGRSSWVRTQGRAMVENGRIVRIVGALQDITLRKLADQAAMDAEQRYSALFVNAPVPMWVFDAENFRFLAVNQTALKVYGFSREEFLASTLYDVRPATERDMLRRYLDNLRGHDGRTWVHQRKNGSIFPARVVSQPVQYAGRPARFAAVLDLTAQHAAEEAMQQHLFTLQRASDAAQAITWHRNLDSMLQEVAEQARGVIGTHQAWVTLTPESEGARALNALSASAHRAEAWKGVELPALRCLLGPVIDHNRAMRLTQLEIDALRQAPGQTGMGSEDDPTAPLGQRAAEWAEPWEVPLMTGCLAVPLLGRSGNNIGLLLMSDKYEGAFSQQDEYVAMELARLVSVAIENAQLLGELNEFTVQLEHKVRERTEALTRQEALFRALAEQAPQVVWTVDLNSRATYFNRAWFELMGGTLGDWSGYKWKTSVHPDDLAEIRTSWERAKAERAQYGGIRRLIARDGSVHTMSYRCSPVLGEDGEIVFWVGIDADVTEIKAIESALRISNEELEAFSYSVSHDLRSPLNTIDGFSRLLSKQIDGEASEKARHYLSRIHAGVAQMGQLIEDLLSLAQVSRAQLRQEPIDLGAMASEVLENLRAATPERTVHIAVESGLNAVGDARLVRVVLENLIGNAWKFSSHREAAAITVGCVPGTASAPVFFVRDNGAGFDMAYADKLFRAFQRLHTAAEFPGTGIGLATVNRVIGRHGGRLWAESAPDQGATFFFTLPKLPPGST